MDGIGGLLAAGRWHSRGRPILYCTSNPATALLEALVHMEIDAEDRPERVQVLKIQAPKNTSHETVKLSSLPAGWEQEFNATREIGDRWLAEGRSLLLKVPSVLAPETWNILVNPAHPQMSWLKILGVYSHGLDPRLRE
jgi:RES domain-containing protein